MKTTGQASFKATTWEETPYAEFDGGRKLTRVHAVFTYEGDIEGEGIVDYLMAYGPDGLGNFVRHGTHQPGVSAKSPAALLPSTPAHSTLKLFIQIGFSFPAWARTRWQGSPAVEN